MKKVKIKNGASATVIPHKNPTKKSWFYDETDRPTGNEKYSVHVKGVGEVSEGYVSKNTAEKIAEKWLDKGYDDVFIEDHGVANPVRETGKRNPKTYGSHSLFYLVRFPDYKVIAKSKDTDKLYEKLEREKDKLTTDLYQFDVVSENDYNMMTEGYGYSSNPSRNPDDDYMAQRKLDSLGDKIAELETLDHGGRFNNVIMSLDKVWNDLDRQKTVTEAWNNKWGKAMEKAKSAIGKATAELSMYEFDEYGMPYFKRSNPRRKNPASRHEIINELDRLNTLISMTSDMNDSLEAWIQRTQDKIDRLSDQMNMNVPSWESEAMKLLEQVAKKAKTVAGRAGYGSEAEIMLRNPSSKKNIKELQSLFVKKFKYNYDARIPKKLELYYETVSKLNEILAKKFKTGSYPYGLNKDIVEWMEIVPSIRKDKNEVNKNLLLAYAYEVTDYYSKKKKMNVSYTKFFDLDSLVKSLQNANILPRDFVAP